MSLAMNNCVSRVSGITNMVVVTLVAAAVFLSNGVHVVAFGFVARHTTPFTSTRSTYRTGLVLSSTATSTASSGKVTLDGTEIRGPITPLGNFVLVKSKESLSASEGGILLPDQAKERPTEGTVVAAGPGKLHPHTGVRIHCPVEPGMNVLHGKFDGTNLEYNEDTMNMIRDDDIMLYYTGTQMTMENVMPCRDYILVLNDASSLQTESGIVVASTVTKNLENCEGVVLKVGEGRMTSTGEFSPSPVQKGDRVKFRDYSGNDVKIKGKQCSLVRMVDILCAVEEDKGEEEV